MPLKIVRNDLTLMKVDAIVNTANPDIAVGPGCDAAIYAAAGRDLLLEYRRREIGRMPEGEVFSTPGFRLPVRYIIHAVSPRYVDGNHGEEELLRGCYRKSLELAKAKNVSSIAFPLIGTGSFHYPKAKGLMVAMGVIGEFLLTEDMDVYLTLFDAETVQLGKKLYPDLQQYIDQNYVSEKTEQEYAWTRRSEAGQSEQRVQAGRIPAPQAAALRETPPGYDSGEGLSVEQQNKLKQRINHLTDTFSEYLMFLIGEKGMKNKDVYEGALVDRKVFSKIKNTPDYHPQKITALCLCIGARLNLDEARDLLARAGYALSPCDKTDIIFRYFIENGIYDIIDLDIQLEEHGLPCLIE